LVTPSKSEILKHAKRLDMMSAIGQGLPTITPEDYELRESGEFSEAQHDLMRSEESRHRGEQERYLKGMAGEMGLRVLEKKEFSDAKKGMKKLGFEWTNGWSKKKEKTKPEKVQKKRWVRRVTYRGERIRIVEKAKRYHAYVGGKSIGGYFSASEAQAYAEGHIDKVRSVSGILAKPKRTPIQRVSLRKPLDVGSMIRGRALVKPKKKHVPTVKSPAEIILAKSKKKRKRNHTERTGKTMRKLRGINGVKVFSFPDDVWKVRKKRRKKKR